MIDRGKRSKTLSEVKPVGIISKNLQSFLEISLVQKQVLPLRKLQDQVYESWNPFGLKADNSFTEKLSESIESSEFVSHRAKMSGEFDSRKDSYSAKFERRSFREFCDSKLFVFLIWIFFHEHSPFTGQQGKGESIPLFPLYHFHPLHRHSDT